MKPKVKAPGTKRLKLTYTHICFQVLHSISTCAGTVRWLRCGLHEVQVRLCRLTR